MTNFQKENITNLYLQNYSASYIAKFLEISFYKVNHFIKENDLQKQRDDKNIRLLISLCSGNFTRAEIAEKLNITEEKVSRLVKKYKIPSNFRAAIFNQREGFILKEYRKQPVSCKELSRKYHISENFVRNIYKKHHLKNIRTNTRTFLVLDKIKYFQLLYELKNTDMSLSKLGEKYHISRQRVYQIQKKNNIIRSKFN